MKVVITYNEISDIIEKRLRIRPDFTTIDTNTFDASYKPGFLMPTITIRFHVNNISQDVISLSYKGSTAAAHMISGAVAYLEEKIPSGIEVNTGQKQIKIYPHRIKQMEKVLEYVTLSNIVFEDNTVNVGLTIA